jgi:hypothetical protein
VGISRSYPDGLLETLCATDDKVRAFDSLQSRVGEGPCIYAIDAETVVHVPDAHHDRRWPRYLPLATHRGLGSQVAVQLHTDGASHSGLNIYSTTVGALDESSAHAADLFAAHAAQVMGHARTVGELQEAMQSRQRIGVAVGILMQRYEMNEDRAFAFLVRASSHSNVKLRDVAAEVVATAGRETPGDREDGGSRQPGR